MKICTTCGIEKDESEFRKNNYIKCGLDGACKPCKALEKKRWKDKNRENYLAQQREYAKQRYRENPERDQERHKEWIRKNPQIAKASEKKSAAKAYQKFKPERVKKAREYRENNREKVREQGRRWKAENYEYVKRKTYEYIARYPEKKKAVAEVNNAIMYGKMTKPTQCTRCFKEGHIEGHHPDYSKPLDVIWLCRECHNKEHGK